MFGRSVKGLSLEPLGERVRPKELNLEGISWVIVGGESGRKEFVRPFDLSWAQELRDHCGERNVAFFLKQLGRRPVFEGEEMRPATAMEATGASGRRICGCGKCRRLSALGDRLAIFHPCTQPDGLPWLKSVTRDIGIAWHRRLMDIRPMAAQLLEAMEVPITGTLKNS